MSALGKVKAYFGMAPMEDYEDDYYEHPNTDSAAPQSFHSESFDHASPRYDAGHYDEAPTYRDNYDPQPHYRREFDHPHVSSSPVIRNSTHGALAMDTRRVVMMREEVSPTLSKIIKLRPKDYSDARTIGEHFRDGAPVIMDLVSMDNADAKRLVDFAAGLVFALRGSFDKIATKVFLLSPADIDVSPEERRQIVETGFYSYR